MIFSVIFHDEVFPKEKWHTMFKETVHFVNEADFLGLVSWLERNIANFGMHDGLLLKVFAVNMFNYCFFV